MFRTLTVQLPMSRLVRAVTKELRGAVVNRLDYCAGDPGSIPAGAEFQTVLGDNT